MPVVRFRDKEIHCETGANLRKVLFEKDNPHNGRARWLNCKGMGTCGTCAVRIEGPVPPLNRREKARLSFPPHHLESGLRLACQIRVEGDLQVTKFPGFWGQDLPDEET